ncbi:MAG: putative DNA-binding domain-containing protein [Asticcacaulis sp.]
MSRFYEDVFAALRAPEAAPPLPEGIPPEFAPRFRVYRNTVYDGLVRALCDNHLTVLGVVGQDWMRACARIYASEVLPDQPSLMAYGRSFPEWLRQFEPARDLPYLADLALLDRLWLDSFFAPDAPVLEAEAFAGLSPEAMAITAVRLNPSLRIATFDTAIVSLWLALREPHETADDLELGENPETAMILRGPDGGVVTTLLRPGQAAFLSALSRGDTLLSAADCAVTVDETYQIAEHFSDLIRLGVFAALHYSSQKD